MEGTILARRFLFVLAAIVVLVSSVSAAQRGDTAGRGGPGPINAYAHADCSASNAPTVQIVVVTGPVPAAVPAAAPQPSVKLVFNTTVDKLVGQQSLTISPDAAKGGPNVLALSCPVVGDCVPAQSGTISMERRADDGAIVGTYQSTWPGSPQRNGRFTAVWRESNKKCG